MTSLGGRRRKPARWSRRKRLALILAVLPVCLAVPLSAAIGPDRIRSILERNCTACHGEGTQSAGVRLDTLPLSFSGNRRAAEVWQDVSDVLNRGEMPPRDAIPISPEDFEALVGWVTAALGESGVRSSGGKPVVVMRRLNSAEYQNTMRDLLGLDIDYVRHLPPDQVSRDGFRNNGAVLTITAMQLEHYLDAARDGLRRAIVTGPAPPVSEHRATETVVDKLKTVHWSNRLGRTGTFVLRVPEFPDEGEFSIKVRARAELPDGAPYPRMRVVMGYRADTQTPSRTVAEVDVSELTATEFEFRGRIEQYPLQSRTQSKYPGLLVWISNAYSDGRPAPTGEKVRVVEDGKERDQWVWPVDPGFPSIVVEEVSFKAPVYRTWPPAHHARIIPQAPDVRRDESRSFREVARRFMRRAYRRPPRGGELRVVLESFSAARPTVGSFEEAAREALALVLISPGFLYRPESTRRGGRLTDHQLASRLSYFLWSTMPDDRLFDLASRGSLGPATLRREVRRMLASPRAEAFVEEFSDQWLDLPGVHRVAVNPNYYPDFDPTLKADMRRETQQFFAAVLREDLSALHFLRSDFAMLNQRMARHYGLAGPRGGEFERVPLARTGRLGGLLSQASVLLANSTGEDSHPVERGVWVRSALLGDPPSPPPPEVPNLGQGDSEASLLPLRRQLELHRDSQACVRCHQGIDPWGVALEEFDAVGLRRESVVRRSGDRVEALPVDATAVLPGGHTVEGVEGLSAFLATERRRDFARALVSKLLAYALGRDIELSDRPAIDAMTDAFESSGYRLTELCGIIVTSDLFRGG